MYLFSLEQPGFLMDLSEKRKKLMSILGRTDGFVEPSPVLTETKMDQVSRSNIV